MFSKAIGDLSSGLKLSHVWMYQAYHDISAKYKRTVFGSLWIVGHMVFMSVAFSIVTGALWGQKIEDTLPYVMGGILGFNLIGSILGEAPETYLSNSGIISNHAYPFTYYSLESTARHVLTFGHNLVVFVIILAACQHLRIPHWTVLFGLPLVCINLLTWGSLVGMMSARYRDLRYLLPYLVTVVMFMTPIMWDVKRLEGPRLLLVHLNPFYPFVEMIRSPLMGYAMATEYWVTAAGITVVGILLWLVFFNMFRSRISFWV